MCIHSIFVYIIDIFPGHCYLIREYGVFIHEYIFWPTSTKMIKMCHLSTCDSCFKKCERKIISASPILCYIAVRTWPNLSRLSYAWSRDSMMDSSFSSVRLFNMHGLASGSHKVCQWGLYWFGISNKLFHVSPMNVCVLVDVVESF